MKVVSKNEKVYYAVAPEKQRINHERWYDKNKEQIVRKKILAYSLEVLGRIPTLSSIEKYNISPGELIQHFGVFKKNCQDAELLEKSQAKVMSRIQAAWA